ncbi:protein SpAN-like [Patiria miniata]|uniref:Metalloendopeptidase n=1 Tax=Patiria miniata TaxID=46514 RepID=A0A914AAK7_PATMI|nr:protein SpAN-like [Patiria miniata]
MSNTAMKWFLHVLIYFAITKLALSGPDTPILRPEVGDDEGPHPEPPEQLESPGTFQSDMLLTHQQAEDIVTSVKGMMALQKRRAVRTGYWPDAKIIYQIDENFGATMVTKINEAMEWWRQDTCVTFEEYVPSSTPDSDHRVVFKKGYNGCYSDVGMIDDFPQHIHLQEDTCDVTGTIAHEIGHTAGWWHEHARIDRELYVTIRYENIQDGKEKQFVMHESESYGVPYDTESIMHYASTYYSKNDFVTIEPHKPLEAFKMGNRKYFTFFDKKLANLMYNCSGVCTEDLQCENDGYVGQDCICHCKLGYSGENCELYTARDEDDPCYKEFEAKFDSDQQLNSPGTPLPYEPMLYCPWLITAPEGSTVILTFLFLDTEGGSCKSDYVKVRSGTDIFYGGDSYCGQTLPEPIESVGNQMIVIFKSDGSIQGRGFRAQYRANPAKTIPTTPEATTPEATTPKATTEATTPPEEPTTQLPATDKPIVPKCGDVEGSCGGVFNVDSGCIASPNFGNGEYNNNEECVYRITVDSGKRVELRLEKLDVEYQDECTWDRVVVIPGQTHGSVRVCGESVPEGSFVSLDNTMTVKMISDALKTQGGFSASFQGITVD